MQHDEATRLEVASLLSLGFSYREVERASGVSTCTVNRWMRDDDFRGLVTAAQARLREVAELRLRGMASRALGVLEDAMDEQHPDRVKVALEVLDRIGLVKGSSVTVRTERAALADDAVMAELAEVAEVGNREPEEV